MGSVNWNVVFGPEGRALFASGLWITVQLAFFAIVFSTLIGSLIAVGRVSKSPALRPLRITLTALVEFIRNVPVLVQLAFWYFGVFGLSAVQWLVSPLTSLYSIEFIAGACALIVYRSAYIAEAIRSGLQSVPRGQYEAARASGLGYLTTMVRIILPQAYRMSLPALINHYVGVTKNTSIVLVIGVPDLVFQAYTLTSRTFEVFLVMGTAVATFVVLCTVVSSGFNALANYLDHRWGYVRHSNRPHSLKSWLEAWAA
ncbi:amino acid ABC transporter permease [Aquamicrobium ahrensii]|uniref:His/Glu/Gln/Arg/opine family amino acid ABC transporter permease subunit n=1 Tax=Aquamicrobium ahrensii TaxID=469551 RepID=A0ABV2KM82_9HYPH